MGKHETGYARVEKDFYPTPAWVTQALLKHIDIAGLRIWEPAAGDGRMAEVLKAAGASVFTSDISARGYKLDAVLDFTQAQMPNMGDFTGIITNPPYGERGKLATQFIQVGLQLLPACHSARGRFRLRKNPEAPLRWLPALRRQDRSHEPHRLVSES